MTAVRDGDALVGTLDTIDDSHAYWIFQKNGDDIKGLIFLGIRVEQVVFLRSFRWSKAGNPLFLQKTLSGAAQWDPGTLLQWIRLGEGKGL
ncbi:MAG: hypothetical protein CM1200mP3_08460 [Chloroflexota bacterium]|nr:MAG: hypothetical protein CM1200mP3_08460 [Chloroflexota bacterium]